MRVLQRSGRENCTISHNLLMCDTCKIIEFPGTGDGPHARLTLNVSGKLFDQKSRKCLAPAMYAPRHFGSNCGGRIVLRPVRLATDRVASLGMAIGKTPPLPILTRASAPWIWQSHHPTDRGLEMVRDDFIQLFRSLLSPQSKSHKCGWVEELGRLVRTGLSQLPQVMSQLSDRSDMLANPLRNLTTLWSLDMLGAHQPALRQGLDVQVTWHLRLATPVTGS